MAKSLKTVQSPANIPAMDAKDIQILVLLQQNARMSVKEIADQVHLSTTPVHERIRRMETSGIIRQYVALLDNTKVGRSLMAICYVSLKEHSRDAGIEFIKAINAMPEVMECYTISGEFDFMLKVMTEDMNAYHDFHVNKLSSIQNMGHVQSVFVMGVIKQTQQLLWAE